MNKLEKKRITKFLGDKVSFKTSKSFIEIPFDVDRLLLITSKNLHNSGYNYIEIYGYIKDKNILYYLSRHDFLDIRGFPIKIDSIGVNILVLSPLREPYKFNIESISSAGLRINGKGELS